MRPAPAGITFDHNAVVCHSQHFFSKQIASERKCKQASDFFRFLPVLVSPKIGNNWKQLEKIDPGWTHLDLFVPDRNTVSRTRYTFASSNAANTGRPVARQDMTVRIKIDEKVTSEIKGFTSNPEAKMASEYYISAKYYLDTNDDLKQAPEWITPQMPDRDHQEKSPVFILQNGDLENFGRIAMEKEGGGCFRLHRRS